MGRWSLNEESISRSILARAPENDGNLLQLVSNRKNRSHYTVSSTEESNEAFILCIKND